MRVFFQTRIWETLIIVVMLKGRLGLETARIPHVDRAGLLWLSRGALTARDGSLSFERKADQTNDSPLESGHYSIPFQVFR